MRKFCMKSVLKMTRFDLRTNRKQILGWIISIFSIMFLYMILFSSMQDIATAKLEAMPKELLQFVGMESITEMGNYTTYFGMIYMLVIVAISVFAVTFVVGLLYKEEKTKSIEFLYSLEVSRTEIYVSKALTGFIAVLLVLISAIVSTLICGYAQGGETFDLVKVMTIGKLTGFIPFVFYGLGLFLVGLTSRINVSMIGSMSVFGCYLIGYLSALLGDKAEWLAYFSPFEMFAPAKVLVLTNEGYIVFGIYGCLLILFVTLGAIFYKRRDFTL